MPRKIFTWVDDTGRKVKKYRDISTTPKMMMLLEEVIETPKQAESFKKAYAKASKDSEYNIGYFAGLISDPDLREDVLDLFDVEEQLSPRQMFDLEYRFSPSR